MPRSHKTAGARGGGGVLPGRGPLAPGLAKRPRRGGAKPRPSGASALCAPAAPPGPSGFFTGSRSRKGNDGAGGRAPQRGAASSVCRKSGLRHFFEVFIAPLRLRRGQGAMQGNPCCARLFADLTRMSPNPIKASGGCGPRTPGGFSTGAGGRAPQRGAASYEMPAFAPATD